MPSQAACSSLFIQLLAQTPPPCLGDGGGALWFVACGLLGVLRLCAKNQCSRFQDHQKLDTVLGEADDSILAVIKQQRPTALIIENVSNFAKPDPVTARVPVVMFIEALQAIKHEDGTEFYQAFHIFELDPTPWIDMGRARTHEYVYAFIDIGVRVFP